MRKGEAEQQRRCARDACPSPAWPQHAAFRHRPDLTDGRVLRFTPHLIRAHPVAPMRLENSKRMAGNPLAESFMANRAALLRYLRARGAGDDAEDLLQELWLKLESGVEVSLLDPLAYLYRMTHNIMLDRRRTLIRRQNREEIYQSEVAEKAEDAPHAERVLLARERLQRIDRTLAALGPRTDLIFRRYRVEGVAQRDIAAELGITLSAVEKHLQKAYRAVVAAQRAEREEDIFASSPTGAGQ